MKLVFIGAAKSGGGKGRSRRRHSGGDPPIVVPFSQQDRSGGGCVDQVARDMACAAVLLWANTLAVTIDMLVQTGLPRDILHELLHLLDRANDSTLDRDSASLAHGFIQAMRERLAAND